MTMRTRLDKCEFVATQNSLTFDGFKESFGSHLKKQDTFLPQLALRPLLNLLLAL